MNIDRFVMGVAGGWIILSLLLSQIHHENWTYLSGFIGVMLLQSSITKFCPLVLILKKIGLKAGRAFD